MYLLSCKMMACLPTYYDYDNNEFSLNWSDISYFRATLLRVWYFADCLHGNDKNLESVDMEFSTRYNV